MKIKLEKYIIFSTLLLSLIYKIYCSDDNIQIKFTSSEYTHHTYGNETVFCEYNYYNYIKTKINIGTPPKEIPVAIRLLQNNIYVDNKDYNMNQSSSYKRIRSGNDTEGEATSLYDYEYLTGYKSTENIILNSNKINDFKFILIEKTYLNPRYKMSVIGLNFPGRDTLPNFNNNFLYQLKNNNLIKKLYFSAIFDKAKNNKEGILLLGALPHEINSSISDDLIWTSAEILPFTSKWRIKFEKIYYDTEEAHIGGADLIIENAFIIGNKEYRKVVKKFFSEVKGCKEKDFLNEVDDFIYYYYICEKDVDKEKMKKVPGIKFYNMELNKTFELNSKDLFMEIENKFFFMVIFDKEEIYGWKLGKIFFEKYITVFDYENKKLGFYLEKKIIPRNKDKITIMTLVLICICLVLFIIFIIFKYKRIKNLLPRFKRANEMNDDNYIYYNNNSKNINSNNNNNIEMNNKLIG